MFQSKSFNLATEKFQFSKLRWTKYLVLPGLLAFVLLLILSNLKPNDYFEEPMNNTNKRSAEPSTTLCEFNDTCCIKCSGEIVNLQDFLAPSIPCQTIELTLFNCIFPEKKIPTNWLEGEFTFKIEKLGFYQCSLLNEIEPNAFSTKVFTELKEISFWKVSLNKIYSDTFSGLSGIQTLEFFVNYNENLSYDSNYLQPVSETLEKFTFEFASLPKAINPKNLIGTSKLELLSALDIGNNKYQNLIEPDTFNILPRIKHLFLQNSGITTLKPQVFDFIAKTVQLIDLRYNLIVNLPNDFFNNLLPPPPLHSAILEFKLEDNLLDCSCDSSYLFDIIKNNPTIFVGDLKCVAPSVVEFKKLTEVDKCVPVEPQATGSPECISDDYPATESTSPDSVDLFKIECDKDIEHEYVELEPADVSFTVATVSATSVKVKMHGSSKDYAVLWFNNSTTNVALMEMNYKDYGLGCRSNFEGELTIDDLKTGIGYTFCFIKGQKMHISLFNCHSHFIDKKTSEEEENWFNCESQSFIITMFSIGIMLAVILGALSMFCLIRWKPTIVKGSKRVVVINNGSSDVMILPRNSSSSFESTTNNTTVSTNSFSFRKKLLRRMSDISIESGRSYMVPGNTYEVVQYQRQTTIDQGKTYFESAPKETPPPLPKRFSVQSTLPKDEMFYISQEYHKYYKPRETTTF